MDVGLNIRFYRKKKRLSQKELASKIFVSERTIGHYETGTRSPNLEVLEQLAEALSIQTYTFFMKITREKRREPEDIVKTDFLLFEWKNNEDTFQLMPLKERVCCKDDSMIIETEVYDKLVYFNMISVNRIIDVDFVDFTKGKPTIDIDDLKPKNIRFVNLHKKAKNNYFILSEVDKNKMIAIGVDNVLEITHIASIFPTKKPLLEYVKDTLSQLRYVGFRISMVEKQLIEENKLEDTFKFYVEQITDLIRLIEERFSLSTINLKIDELVYMWKNLSYIEKEILNKTYLKNIEDFKKVNSDMNNVDELIKIHILPFDEVISLLVQLKNGILKYEAM